MATEGEQHRARSRSAEPSGDVSSRSADMTPQDQLLTDRIKLAWAAQHAYFERASILNALNYLIGIPVVVVTALAGSQIIASRATDEPVPIWVAVILVSAAVLASLQTFFRFGERSAFSAIAGHRYAVLRRRIEDALASSPRDQKELASIRKQMDDTGEQSPPIGERRWLTWKAFSEWNHPPEQRPWWKALFGFPGATYRKSRNRARPARRPSPPS
jgi:hypothetical protein